MKNLNEIAKNLRKNPTRAEMVLWEHIRNRQILGIKFRRQVPLNYGDYRFIPDFCSFEKRIIIEVDGGIHNDPFVKEYDKIREDVLKNGGYRIVRFSNDEIIFSIEKTMEKLINFIREIK